ncbi:MAG: hypothetical protein U1F44_00055 [Coriobacteriia bacterium]|nr:hypothetical protein [Coriobacteriia bacterium]
MIVSFKDADTARLAGGQRVKRFIAVESVARQHSIRVNDQYRVCFRWTAAGPEDVEIVDYH